MSTSQENLSLDICGKVLDSNQPTPLQKLARVMEFEYEPAHPPGLIRVFAVRMKKGWILSYP